MTVEVFDQLANYQGEQKGWFAKVIKDKFNIKLNIVARTSQAAATRCSIPARLQAIWATL